VARLAAQEAAAELEFLALGEEAPPEQVGRAWIRFVPFQRDPRAVVAYYQAADVYIHAARADTFPLVVLEAQAAGCPVVATAVGGIPEQLEDTVTGRLTPPGDAGAMAEAVAGLLAQPTARAAMGLAAAARATRLYDRERQISAYLEWFQEILDVRRIGPSPPGSGRPRLAAPS
jgi:glycosyltransferase involved in cell wall biosynthesis